MDNDDFKPVLKNVKISEQVHKQIKRVAIETGVNVGKLIELGALKIIEDFKSGKFDSLKNEYSKIRRDGTFTRDT